MAANLAKWPSNRGLISKIRPSDGCGRGAVPLAVERWCNFPVFWGLSGKCRLRPYFCPRKLVGGTRVISRPRAHGGKRTRTGAGKMGLVPLFGHSAAA